MNKKGFTLIELLAVIVILAIIALIATPIVLNIINDAKEQSGLRSADFYLDALELSIAQSVLKGQTVNDGVHNIKDGNMCLDSTCTEKLEVEVKGEVPTSGLIYIKNGQIDDISLTLNNKVIDKNDKGELVYMAQLNEVCELKSETEKIVGAKYECDLGDGARTFYVLEVGMTPVSNSTLKSNEIALILNGNYDDTTLAWCDQSGPNPMDNKCNADGLTPKLDEISSEWTKLSRKQVVLPSVEQLGIDLGDYSLDNPGFSLTETWLYQWEGNDDYNDPSIYYPVSGYWTFTPENTINNCSAWPVLLSGYMSPHDVNNASTFGVRPVINLKI